MIAPPVARQGGAEACMRQRRVACYCRVSGRSQTRGVILALRLIATFLIAAGLGLMAAACGEESSPDRAFSTADLPALVSAQPFQGAALPKESAESYVVTGHDLYDPSQSW